MDQLTINRNNWINRKYSFDVLNETYRHQHFGECESNFTKFDMDCRFREKRVKRCGIRFLENCFEKKDAVHTSYFFWQPRCMACDFINTHNVAVAYNTYRKK